MGEQEGDSRGRGYIYIYIYIVMTNSVCCMAETHKTLQSNHPPIKNLKMIIWGSLLISQISVSHPEAADSDSPGEETGVLYV